MVQSDQGFRIHREGRQGEGRVRTRVSGQGRGAGSPERG